MKQPYLVSLTKLMVADGVDVAVKWSAVFDEDKLTGLLKDAAELVTLQLNDAPLEDLRPMTLDEVTAWRDDQ